MFQFQLPPLDVTPRGRGDWIGSEMNKYEQVSSDHHPMSLTGGRGLVCPEGVGMSGGGGLGVVPSM